MSPIACTRTKRSLLAHRVSLEALEPRTLLAAYAPAEFFPLNNGTTWSYSGTLDGHAVTAVSTLSPGGLRSGVPTKKIVTVLTPDDGGLATTDTRNYANTNTGLRVFRENTIHDSLTANTLFADGLTLLPSIVNDGDIFSYTKAFTGAASAGRQWSGTVTGQVRIIGLETIDTRGGSYEALKISITESTEGAGSGFTATGIASETRWIVRGIGTVRIDSAAAMVASDIGESSLRFNLGLVGSNRLGDLSGTQVKGQGVAISFGDTSPSPFDGTNFAGVDINGGVKTRNFKIFNTSLQPITLVSGAQGFVSIQGANAADFVVTRQPSQVIQPGGFTIFSVRVDPSALGFRYATVSFATANSTDHPFTFNIRAAGIQLGVINIAGSPGSAISNGASTPTANTGTRFGTATAAGNSTITRTFVISNSGPGALLLTGIPRVVVSGSDTSAFVVSSDPTARVASGGSTTFTITFDPSAIGAERATISVFSNDRTASLFTFAIVGTGV